MQFSVAVSRHGISPSATAANRTAKSSISPLADTIATTKPQQLCGTTTYLLHPLSLSQPHAFSPSRSGGKRIREKNGAHFGLTRFVRSFGPSFVWREGGISSQATRQFSKQCAYCPAFETRLHARIFLLMRHFSPVAVASSQLICRVAWASPVHSSVHQRLVLRPQQVRVSSV